MSVVESIESGILSTELREALRTLLSQINMPYLDHPGTSDGPGICISTSLADFRRHIEMKHQEKLDSQPKVPANYRPGGGRRKLPDGPIISHMTEEKPKYHDAATQTQTRPEAALDITTQSRHKLDTPRHIAQTESAPESQSRSLKKARRRLVSDSSDVDIEERRKLVAMPRPSPRSDLRHSPIESHGSSRIASSPCAWEKAIKEPVGPIYGPEDTQGRWASNRSRKRKADSDLLPRPDKRPATGVSSKPDIISEVSDSDADDEEDESQQNAAESLGNQDQQSMRDNQDDEPTILDTAQTIVHLESSPLSSIPPSDTAPPSGSVAGHQSVVSTSTVAATGRLISSIEGVEVNVVAIDAASVLVIPSSQDSASSQSGSDSQNQVAKIDKNARAALHQIELATGSKSLRDIEGR